MSSDIGTGKAQTQTAGNGQLGFKGVIGFVCHEISSLLWMYDGVLGSIDVYYW
jgi:hypothetical protein